VVRTRQSERVGIWGRVELAAANESLRRENQGLKEQLAVALQKKRRVSGGDVSAFLAWIGSPCLRHCVHGASIGGGGGTAGVAGAEHAAHARRRRLPGQRRARSAGRLARRRWGAAALGCAAERTPDSTEQMIKTD
jgi:hypothetical protein